MPAHTPCILIIRDGWGANPYPDQHQHNAVALARTPVADRLMREFPHTLIKTSGEDVGLDDGTMGNSEVGHQNIGAGRVVDQESVRITKACRNGELKHIAALTGPIARARDAGRTVHLLGICSDAGVHGLLTHLEALLDLCGQMSATRVALHLFTDGRDTGPFLGRGFVERIAQRCARTGVGVIASVIGRYWAMDRDYRWDRIEKAYNCMTGRGNEHLLEWSSDPALAVQRHYDRPAKDTFKGDEFVPATMIGATRDDAMKWRIADGDTVIFYNYRGDRPRQIMAALAAPQFDGHMKPSPDSGARGFDRGPRLNIDPVIMTAYSEELAGQCKVAFPKPPKMEDIAGQFISRSGLTQFRCAETEKFAHVTFFFNDYRDQPFEGERREIVQSPKVATYDQAPEMSAAGVRDAVLGRLRDASGTGGGGTEPFMVVNFANPDMVGHTGNLQAAIRACEFVDSCVGAIVDEALPRGFDVVVTADHGNAEQMWDAANNCPHTAHTVFDVPLILVGERFRVRPGTPGTLRTLRGDTDVAGWFDASTRAKRGRLADVVPTMLAVMGLKQPAAMTGESLLA